MSKTARVYQRQGGFSLLEVLVAFAILAASLGVLLPVFQGGLRSTALARDYNHALILAESKLAEIAAGDFRQYSVTEGDFGDKFHWRSVVDEYATAITLAPAQSVRTAWSIAVTVNWGQPPRSRSVVLTTLRLSNG